MSTFEQAIISPRSEKVILCMARAVAQYKVFSVHSGSVYVRNVDHWVDSVKQGATSLSSTTGTSLSAGQFYFSSSEKKLYVRMTDSSNPKTKEVAVTHKFFFSDAPLILPNDLSTGVSVEFEPLINAIGSLGQQLDDENTGIVLESSSSIDFINAGGYFDMIFDTLIWENKQVDFYSWFPTTPITEAKRIFSGVVESKDFAQDKVIFKVKDFVYRLKNEVVLRAFSESDGNIDASTVGRPKRRVYGQAQQMKCTGIDKVLSGYFLTGTISGTIDSKTITGIGTSFLSELSPGDEVNVTIDGEKVKLQVDIVTSDTAFELGDELSISFAVLAARVKPERPYRQKNRRWHIAGHLLTAPSTEILTVQNGNRFIVDDASNFFVDDVIKVNSDYTRIRRISGNTIVTTQAVSPLPSVGDFVEKSPVSKVLFGSQELVIDRDYTVDNGTDTILEIDPLAEFNVAKQRKLTPTLLWTNGSRVLTTSSAGDLRTLISTRDWIRKDRLDEATWYEVLSVSEQAITIRTAFSGTTETINSLYKNVTVIEDESLITVDCMGYDDIANGGGWIKTASDAVRHLCLYDAEFSQVNESSFAQAKIDCNFKLSLVIPESVEGKAPKIRDVISKINESVFGSLSIDSNQLVKFAVFDIRKASSLSPITDSDIISWDASSTQAIANEIKLSFRPYIDAFTGDDAFLYKSFTSSFVDNLIGIKNVTNRTVYLFDEADVTIIAQRISFFSSMSQSRISLKGKMNFANAVVGDKVYLELDRLYARYGSTTRKKVGIISGIKKNGRDCDVEIIDFAGIFNRVGYIAPNTASAYASASEDDKTRWSFVLDNDTKTPDVSSDIGLGTGLVG